MAVNVPLIKQLTNSSAKFEDLFSYNISDGEPTQNRIRLVKVGGKNYIAFSRFFLNKESNTYLPSKKHFFLPAHQWASIRAGLKLLNSILKSEAKKNESSSIQQGPVATRRVRFDNQSTNISGKRFILPFDGANCGIASYPSSIHTSITSGIIPAQNIHKSNSVASSFTFPALPPRGTLSNYGFHRQRGRPPKAIPLAPLNFQKCPSITPEASNIPVFTSSSASKCGRLAEEDTERNQAATGTTAEDSITITDIDLDECC